MGRGIMDLLLPGRQLGARLGTEVEQAGRQNIDAGVMGDMHAVQHKWIG